jgi:hypothetical protein
VSATAGRRVALVHDWLTGMRGGEKVLDAICEVFPDAPLTTLVRVPGSVSARIEARPIRTSFVQALPAPARFYRHYLPLYPLAVRLLDFQGADLVVSSSHCAAKSVIVPEGAVHVCYCHSPMRYAWDQFEEYFGPARVGPVTSRLMRPVMRRIARWDQVTADRVDRFLANSQYVAGRIRRYYNRGSTIVYPPVDTDYYTPQSRAESQNFLIVSALVPYKRLDVAIDACRRLQAPLRIVGRGRSASGSNGGRGAGSSSSAGRPTSRFASSIVRPGRRCSPALKTSASFRSNPRRAEHRWSRSMRAAPAKRSSTARPAYSWNGTSVEAFAGGLERALQTTFDPVAVRRNAERFSRANFITSFTLAVEQAIADKARGGNADAARWGATAPPVFPDPWPPAAEDEGHPDGLPVAAPRADTGNKEVDVAGSHPGRRETDPPARQSHRSSILMPARNAPPPVEADRENKP